MWGAYAVGVLCSLFGFLYLRCEISPEFCVTLPHVMPSDTHPSYNDQGQYTAPVVLFSFIIGAQFRE